MTKPIVHYSTQDISRALTLLREEIELHIFPSCGPLLRQDIIDHWTSLRDCGKLDIDATLNTDAGTGRTTLTLVYTPVTTAKPKLAMVS